MKKTLIPIVLFTLLCFSCKKDNSITRQAYFEPAQNTSSEIGPNYSANLHDVYGDLHNQGLSYVLGNPNLNYMTDNELINYTNNWGYSSYNVFEQNLLERVLDFLEDQPNNYINEINNTTYSAPVKEHLRNLISLISDDSYEDPTAITYGEYKDKITGFEDGIIADPTLTTSQREVILATASIARYSMYYGWQHVDPVPPSSMAMSKVTKLAIAASADAANLAHSWSLTEAVATSVLVYRHLP